MRLRLHRKGCGHHSPDFMSIHVSSALIIGAPYFTLPYLFIYFIFLGTQAHIHNNQTKQSTQEPKDPKKIRKKNKEKQQRNIKILPKLTVALMKTIDPLVDVAGGRWRIHISNQSSMFLCLTRVTAARCHHRFCRRIHGLVAKANRI